MKKEIKKYEDNLMFKGRQNCTTAFNSYHLSTKSKTIEDSFIDHTDSRAYITASAQEVYESPVTTPPRIPN